MSPLLGPRGHCHIMACIKTYLALHYNDSSGPLGVADYAPKKKAHPDIGATIPASVTALGPIPQHLRDSPQLTPSASYFVLIQHNNTRHHGAEGEAFELGHPAV